MTPRHTETSVVVALALAVLLAGGAAGAQSAGHRAVRRQSGVTGVELGLEGALAAPRGGTLRWLATAYEVAGLQDLRPAPGATIGLTTSLDPAAAPIEATTDADGRAALSLRIPDDAPDAFRAVITLRSSSAIQRRFELTLRATEPRLLEVFTARAAVAPRGRVHAFGRLADRTTGRPLPQETIELVLRDPLDRPLGAPVRVVTDRAGLFAHVFRVPTELQSGEVTVEAFTGSREHHLTARATVRIEEPQAPPLILAVAPRAVVANSEQLVPVDVVLRTAGGRPVPRAEIVLEGVDERTAGSRAVTDERGRALLQWTAPYVSTGFTDSSVSVTARREGYGQARQAATVRVAAVDWAAAVAVEGGALVPSLGGRLWVRVTGIDGMPAPAGVPVSLGGPRLAGGPLRAATDGSGVARFDLQLAAPGAGSTDRCGGDNATAVDVLVGADARRQASLEACLPLDPDAAARVRISPLLLSPGGRIRVEVARTAAARQLPVSVVLLVRRDSGLHALAARVLPAGQDSVELELPVDVVGEVIVRARPLFGAERHEIRGGTAEAWVLPGRPMDLEVTLDGAGDRARIAFSGPADGAREVYVVGLPVDEARALAARLSADSLGPLGDLRVPPSAASEELIAAALAARTTRDAGAPAVLRPGPRGAELVPAPEPEDPEALGLLRDPWRSRARFVTGRLALIFSAIETEVARALPDRIDDVAARDGGRWDFNAEIVETVSTAPTLGSAGATGLGGEPLTIEALQQFDPAFTYDNVARRITRERLFRLILALRQFVQSNAFDLVWSRLGDPSEWLHQLVGQYVPGGSGVQQTDLVDGWGRPFELRAARGGISRFTFVNPLGNWEILSSGPDGSFGTGDDLWDPTARVLPEGSAYARAVGEDVLLARLRGVELGRATIDQVRSTSGLSVSAGGVPDRPEEASGQLAQQLWSQLPSQIEPEPDALALRRPGEPGDGALGRVVSAPDATGLDVALGLDEEPRTWGAVAWAWTSAGFPAVGLGTAVAGAPVIVEGALPRRIRQGERLTLALDLTNLETTARTVNVEVVDAASGGSAILASPRSAVSLGPEASSRASLWLEGAQPGAREVELLVSDASDRPLRRLRFPVTVGSGQAPIRLRAGGAVVGRRWRTRLSLGRDATSPVGRVVVLTPQGLSTDPDLAEQRRDDPALIAWADALAGRGLTDAHRAALMRAQSPDGIVSGREPALSTACSILVWSAMGADDEVAVSALAQARDALPDVPPFADDDPASELRTAAAVLAAVAPGGVPELDPEGGGAYDPVAGLAAQLRAGLRRAIHVYPEEPALLARAAAALLLADPRDGHGRAMAERAAAHLVETDNGGALVATTEARPDALDALVASLALAVAAHQLDRDELAARLVRGAFVHENVLTRAGGEATFWYLAAAAFGAMGTGTPERVTVTADGHEEVVDLRSGRAVVDLARLAGGRTVNVSVERLGGPELLVRAEVVMGRAFDATPDDASAEAPLALELQGDAGRLGELAALELSITARRAVRQPVLDIQLPAGVEAEGQLVEALLATGSVRAAEPREPGFVRVHLAPLAEGTSAILPLPLRWTGSGTLTGLGVIAYPLSAPDAMAVLAPRAFEVQ
jgi:hypothetical protein